ncbi:MAG: 50S ribosomal protein L9 [Rickettsiales bacterium]|jgi:large subunit ribosomal protein L9|nr:50S ribosomal protein L9 [Rickettsiales bacterium]
MEIILLEKVGRLGRLGDRVRVKDGYARNFLLPGKKALRATAANLRYFEEKKASLESGMRASLAAAETVREKIEGGSFVIIRQAGDAGHLYGSVGAKDVAAAVADKAGVSVDPGRISIDTPIKDIGIYRVRVALHPEIEIYVRVNVARSLDEAEVAEQRAAAADKNAASETGGSEDGAARSGEDASSGDRADSISGQASAADGEEYDGDDSVEAATLAASASYSADAGDAVDSATVPSSADADASDEEDRGESYPSRKGK